MITLLMAALLQAGEKASVARCNENGYHWSPAEADEFQRQTGRQVTWRCEARAGSGPFWTPHIEPKRCDEKSPRLANLTLAGAYRHSGRDVRFRCEDGVMWMIED